MDIHLVTSICILKTYYFWNLFVSLLYRYDCGGGGGRGEGGNGGDGLNRMLGMKPSAGDWHDYKKYRCISPVSGIKKIHVEDDRFDFKSEHFLSDRFGII